MQPTKVTVRCLRGEADLARPSTEYSFSASVPTALHFIFSWLCQFFGFMVGDVRALLRRQNLCIVTRELPIPVDPLSLPLSAYLSMSILIFTSLPLSLSSCCVD